MIWNSIIGIAGFTIASLTVTLVLLGTDLRQPPRTAYLLDEPVTMTGRLPLDLSRPIFLRRDVIICATQDALATYAPSSPGDCAVMSSAAQAGVVAIVTNGMRQPTFELQMATRKGTVVGWVDYNDLKN